MYQPQFTITNLILKNIGAIEASREVIDKAPLLPYYEKKFQNEALVKAVHYGTHIEGNALNLTQAEKVMLGQEVIARERDIQEVLNYRKVMEYIGELGQGVKPFAITEDLIFQLHRLTVHKILAEERCGVYRNSKVVIRNSHSGEVSFTPPSWEEVPALMQDLLAFIQDTSTQTLHSVLKSSIVHYEFVRTHPFVDGNGRVARALSTLILFQEGYDIRRFFSLEEYFDSNAASYYDALQSVEKQQGDLTRWLEYFTQGLAIELGKVKEKVESVSIDGKLREKLGGKPLLLSERQLKIIEYIQKVGYLENKVFPSLFPMISEDTVLNDLKSLVKIGVLKKQGVTKGVKYIMA